MGKRKEPRAPGGAVPIPLEPIDLLAGLAPDVELEADDLPAGIAGAVTTEPASVTVNEIGRQLRSGDPTVRRLIRTPVLRPVADGAPAARPDLHRPARDPDKPGE